MPTNIFRNLAQSTFFYSPSSKSIPVAVTSTFPKFNVFDSSADKNRFNIKLDFECVDSFKISEL